MSTLQPAETFPWKNHIEKRRPHPGDPWAMRRALSVVLVNDQ